MEIKKNIKLILITLGLIGVALLAVLWKNSRDQESAKLNHTYEVSLVKALKNSYAGIEEIRMTNPYYTDKPGSWSCDVKIKFKDKTIISYGINHSLHDKTNLEGVMEGDTNEEIDKQWANLHSHEGITEETVKVYYSNGQNAKQ